MQFFSYNKLIPHSTYSSNLCSDDALYNLLVDFGYIPGFFPSIVTDQMKLSLLSLRKSTYELFSLKR